MRTKSLAIPVIALHIVIAVIFISRGRWSDPDPSDAISGASPQMAEFATIHSDREIVIHCGTSMRPAAEWIAYEFQKRTGIAVRFNYGGSSELLAALELGRGGDIYICHDPYAERIDAKGLLARAETAGHLEPVIIVPPANPHNIQSLEDLARPGLRVGLPDSRYATAGELVKSALVERGLLEEVQRNVRLETRGHNDLAVSVSTGQLDAAMAWNFIAAYYGDKLKTIASGYSFPETRVTLCLLKSAQDVAAAEAYMEMAMSPNGQKIFQDLGYGRAVQPAADVGGTGEQ